MYIYIHIWKTIQLSCFSCSLFIGFRVAKQTSIIKAKIIIKNARQKKQKVYFIAI